MKDDMIFRFQTYTQQVSPYNIIIIKPIVFKLNQEIDLGHVPDHDHQPNFLVL